LHNKITGTATVFFVRNPRVKFFRIPAQVKGCILGSNVMEEQREQICLLYLIFGVKGTVF